jgi:hypothetical protein
VAGPFALGNRPVDKPLDTLGALSLSKRRRPYTRLQFSDPAQDPRVTSFPKLRNSKTLTLRFERYRVYDEKLFITGAERIG